MNDHVLYIILVIHREYIEENIVEFQMVLLTKMCLFGKSELCILNRLNPGDFDTLSW